MDIGTIEDEEEDVLIHDVKGTDWVVLVDDCF